MQKSKSQVKIQNLLITFWPIGIIFFVWFIFSSPYFLHGKVPYPSTYHVNNFAPFSAYTQFASPVKNGAMPDVITQIYPWKHFTIETWKSGQIPLWNPYSFSGTPHLANYQSAVLSPFNLLFLLFPFIDAWSLLILFQPLLAGIFMYMFIRSVKISQIGSLISGVAFMFCGFITSWMSYGTLGYAILFLPLVLFAVEKYYLTHKRRFLLLLSLTIPLSFFSGHFQISLYFLLFLVAYVIYKSFQTNSIQYTKYLLLYTFLGLLLAMPQILPSLEFYKQSLRSNLFQTLESIPLGYTPTFLSPDFFGNPVTRNDWFGHYAEWNGYIGVLPFMLALYAFLRHRNKQTIFLFFFGIFILLLAFSTPVLDLLIKLHIPVISTSAASRIIVLYSFVFAILSGFGWDSFYEDIQKRKFRLIFIWILSFLSIFSLLWIIIFFKLFLPTDKLIIAKQNLILPTIIFSIVCLLSIVFYFRINKRYKLLLFFASCFFLLVAFDMLRFVMKWQPFDPKNLVFPSVPTTDAFQKIAGSYPRSFGNYGAEVAVYYHLPSVEGYDPLYINRYGEFIGSLTNGHLQSSYRSLVSFPKDGTYTKQAIDLLNITYIVQKVSDEGQLWGFPFDKYPFAQFTPIYKDAAYRIYKNNAVLPHVFLTENYQVKSQPQKIIDALFAEGIDLRRTVVLEKNPHVPFGSTIGSANIIIYTPNEITIATNAKNASLLFLSDAYYPGWQALVDGRQTEIYRADYAFRAIIVPAGEHTVVFKYRPMSFIMGCIVSFLGILGLISFSFKDKQNLLK